MKKRMKSFLLTGAFSLAVSICASVGIIALAEQTSGLGLQEPLVEQVKIGEVVSIPDYYAEVGGEKVKATANITTPSGVVYSGSKFNATEGGRYIVEYTINGQVVYTDDCLAVIGSMDLLKPNALASIEEIADFKYSPDEAFKGVVANVQSGGTITFDREIEMTTLTKDDVLFRATVEPSVQGEADFQQMVLTFADVEDNATYFKIVISDGHADGASPKHLVYISGGANGQTSGGLNYGKGAPVFNFNEFHDLYGTSVPSTFRAEAYNGYSLYAVTLYYDAIENSIYANSYEEQPLKVVDFDDPSIFGGNVWSGFKSGKAKLTVSFVEVKDSGKVIFNEIGGVSLSEENVVDNVAPELFVDLGKELKAPNAVLGTEYTIFPCVVKDFFDKNVKIDTAVSFNNIFTGEESDVLVSDGKFIVDKLGTYTIRYTATDYTGNQSQVEYSFECIACADEIVLTGIADNFSATALELLELPSMNTVRAFGGNGSLKIDVRVFSPNGEEVALTNNAFIPYEIGEYKVVYTATDYFGESASANLMIDVLENVNTTFMNQIVMPELLIAGFNYVVPEVEAYTCKDGKVILCDIEYIVDGNKLDETRSFVADKAKTNTTIVCRAMFNGSPCGEIAKQVIIINGNHGQDQAAYFYDKTGAITVTETQQGIDLTTTQNSSVSFVNKLKGSAFSLGVNYLTENCHFNSFNVTLSDAERSEVSVTFKFLFTVSGVKITAPFATMTDFPSSAGYFKLNFDANTGMVSDANGLGVTIVDKDDNGNPFTGFKNGLYATLSFNGVESESKISLSWLNNQLLGFHGETEEEIMDTIGPEIELDGEIPVKVKLGDTITLCTATATDVLSQVTSMTVRLLSPSGKEIVAETAANKEISVTLTEIGIYRLFYVSYDSEGVRTRVGQNIRVVDSVAPTLGVDFSDKTSKVGETITLPNVTVSDDSGKVFYDIFLSLPNSEMRILYHCDNGEVTSYLSKSHTGYPSSFKVSDTKFKLEMEGVYVLTVMAYDDAYNITMQSFTITVK